MNVFKKFSIFLILFLGVVGLWAAISIYTSFSEIKIEGEFLLMDVSVDTTKETKDLEDIPVSMVTLEMLTKEIEGEFDLEGFESFLVKVDENLLVDPEIFHALKEKAVTEGLVKEELSDKEKE